MKMKMGPLHGVAGIILLVAVVLFGVWLGKQNYSWLSWVP